MKRMFTLSVFMVMVFVLTIQAQAALNLLGQGTSTHGTYNLIYDTDLDITWYDYTESYDTWDNQMAWADALSVNFGGNVYDDWRLPTVTDTGTPGCNFAYSGTDCGYNVDTSTGEMAHLWYDELGNLAFYNRYGLGPQTGWGLTKRGDFQNLPAGWYWSGSEYAPNSDNAWYFHASLGLQNPSNKDLNLRYAIAVRSGDGAVVTEPILVDDIYYSTLQSAYDEASNGSNIQIKALSLNEALNINRNISITFDGGYDNNFASTIGRTTLVGNMTISNGTLTINNFVIE